MSRQVRAYGFITQFSQNVRNKVWVFGRTDYHLATPAFAALARSEHIYKETRFSDHAPMSVDYQFVL